MVDACGKTLTMTTVVEDPQTVAQCRSDMPPVIPSTSAPSLIRRNTPASSACLI